MNDVILLVIFAGLLNWIITTIIVEGVVFTSLRRRLDRWGLTHGFGHYIELWHCHLCTGTWVGWMLAAVLGGPISIERMGLLDGVAAVFLNGLLYKAAGHVILEATAMMKNHNAMATGDESRRLVYEAERIAEHRHAAWKEFSDTVGSGV